jgi:hypothetical protein
MNGTSCVRLMPARARAARLDRQRLSGLRSMLASAAVPVLLAGCGPSAGTSMPTIAERPDVLITVDGTHHTCVVALPKEPQGSSIPCGEVVPFLRDELRLQSGSVYDIRTVPHVDPTEMAGLGSDLKGAGYRFIGGRKDPFSTDAKTP